MKKIHKKLWIGYLFGSLEIGLLGANFNFSTGTPGRQGAEERNDNQGNLVNCKHIIVPDTNCNLYFPADGSQPSSQDAGEWSGARYNGVNNNRVTDWWVQAFKEDNMIDPNMPYAMGFGGDNTPFPIIQVDPNAPANFEQQFWQTFRIIAADPVGRVLLYRLLIEIRRTIAIGNNNGCCGDEIATIPARNNLRSIKIERTQEGFSFDKTNCRIKFSTGNAQPLTLRINQNNGTIIGNAEGRPNDVALFHEMIHWFHYLRNYGRVIENKRSTANAFKYVMRCYYGDQSELCIWGANCNAEEIATILGVPNHNKLEHLDFISPNAFFPLINRPIQYIPIGFNLIQGYVESYIPSSNQFLNGEDLSENAYRCSRGLHMRFGHSNIAANPVDFFNLPLRYRLAHRVAVDCYTEITGNPPVHWQLQPGEAINN